MAKQEAGFTVGEDFYPFTGRFRMCDPVLIRELTGLEFTDFSERIDAAREDGAGGAQDVLIGMVGVAIWQAHPKWPRAKVIDYVQQLDMADFEAIEGDDANPPEQEASEGSHSPASSGASTSTRERSAGKGRG